MSPHNNDLMASSLPPMSTFRGPGQPGYQSSSPTVNGSQGEMPPSQQQQQQQQPPPPPPPQPQPNNNSSAPPPTGNGPAGSGSQSDALGNALKSVSNRPLFIYAKCSIYLGISSPHWHQILFFVLPKLPLERKNFMINSDCACARHLKSLRPVKVGPLYVLQTNITNSRRWH